MQRLELSALTKKITEEVWNNLKKIDILHYKCFVQVHSGEKYHAGLHIGCRSFWDKESDLLMHKVYENDFFCYYGVCNFFLLNRQIWYNWKNSRMHVLVGSFEIFMELITLINIPVLLKNASFSRRKAGGIELKILCKGTYNMIMKLYAYNILTYQKIKIYYCKVFLNLI